jgi:hypothetical protein
MIGCGGRVASNPTAPGEVQRKSVSKNVDVALWNAVRFRFSEFKKKVG